MLSRNHFFSGMLRQWHRLPSEVVENCVDMALRDMVNGYDGDGLMVALDNFRGFSNLIYSVILS